jgi:hypothetical protein
MTLFHTNGDCPAAPAGLHGPIEIPAMKHVAGYIVFPEVFHIPINPNE